ncbi:MAG TPA: hypothetical protein PLR99_10590 [Polyangiaceae bacterium]|nr:hypothetical protein [Polyangiaceae bacterium]
MDERTRAATYEDVLRVAALLEREGAEYALIGGYALALQGIVRLTEDVDILVEPTAENAARWVRALSQLPDGAALELAGDSTVHEEPYAIRVNDEFTIDVMNSASGYTWAELLPYRRRIDGINVVSLEGLLLMKSHGRLKDQADAEAIRRALAES